MENKLVRIRNEAEMPAETFKLFWEKSYPKLKNKTVSLCISYKDTENLHNRFEADWSGNRIYQLFTNSRSSWRYWLKRQVLFEKQKDNYVVKYWLLALF